MEELPSPKSQSYVAILPSTSLALQLKETWSPSTSAFNEVKLKNPIYGADGLSWGPDGSLIVIANNNAYVGATPPTATNKVIKLNSSDNWASANVTGQANTGDVFATTGTVRDGQFYVIHAMLHVLFNPDTKKHLEQFNIVKYNP